MDASYSRLTSKFAFLQRGFLPFNGPGSTSVPLSSIVGVNFQLGTIALQVTTALRVVKSLSFANCTSSSVTPGFLACLALNLVFTDSSGNPLMYIPGVYSASRMGFQAGVTAIATGDEVILGTDLLQYNNDRKSVLCFIQADVQNFDGAAAHNFFVDGAILFEIWSEGVGLGLRQ